MVVRDENVTDVELEARFVIVLALVGSVVEDDVVVGTVVDEL